ncbi:GvpL/GvpF family gas vesicle protein [Candidatus Parcubacteria bacterium]|nr:GvpL/GvpF family gas vesicle protein [Patescibacteria group bacterium]MCG2698335.1 GvpL/GvpF family gas vesicle protein [Candidatus Parcubacteria bacterium]MCG2700974.1 GvpL/GvpF family gas vesicle protein [Candidatus Parcubacteria bacterium]
MGKYIYCVIEQNKDKRAARDAFGQANASGLSYIGINHQVINILNYQDIAAAVSDTPVINFDRLDKKELTRHIAIHQQVNEEIMKDYNVAPMAFGIIAPNNEEIKCILAKAYIQFKTALKTTAGKVEFAVQVWWDQKKLLEELVNTNSEIQGLRQQLSVKTSILGLPLKLKLGRLIQRQAEAYKQTNIKNIEAFLRIMAHDFTLNKLISEDMIANFSFLIEKSREFELDSKMQELGKKYEGKLRFKYIGPMPPYSFVNINLSLGNFEIINKARKLLSLGEEASPEEIKKAYYVLSHQYHPDKHQDNQETAEQMKKIVRAYSILKSYCKSCGSFFGENRNQRYSFKEEDVRNSLIIK